MCTSSKIEVIKKLDLIKIALFWLLTLKMTVPDQSISHYLYFAHHCSVRSLFTEKKEIGRFRS